MCTSFDAELVAALRAIPGRAYDRESKIWWIRLRSRNVVLVDRARSLVDLLRAYPELELDDAHDQLRTMAEIAQTSFVLDIVLPVNGGPACVSLRDDWVDPELADLLLRGQALVHPEVGRVSLALDCATAIAVGAMWQRRADVLWTPKLQRAAESAPSETITFPTSGPLGAHRNPRQSEPVAAVSFVSGGQCLKIDSHDAATLAARLPGSTRCGHRTLFAAADDATARVLSAWRGSGVVLHASRKIEAWLTRALEWAGQVTAVARHGSGAFVVDGPEDPHPALLDGLPAAATRTGEWTLPMTDDGRRLLLELLAGHPETTIDPQAARCLAHLEAHDGPVPPVLITVEEDEDEATSFCLTALWGDQDFEGRQALDDVRRRRRASDEPGVERFTADVSRAPTVREFAQRNGMQLDQAATALLGELEAAHEASAATVARSQATSGDLSIPGIAGDLLPFQAGGVRYILERRRLLVADEQGLGKTVQALAAIQADDAFPAVVVCPASLKLNWLQEAHAWLPDRTARVLCGRGDRDYDADVLILNYEILGAHVDALIARAPAALILDEAHYCKDPRARRTKEAQRLSDALDDDALRLLLTGTPVVNRTRELVSQLRIIGRLADFGSGEAFARRFATAQAQRRMHWHLRSVGYLRRLKADVLPQLPAKRRAAVPVPIANASDYHQAERSFLSWLAERYADSDELLERIDSATRAQALVKINALRQLVGHGKADAAIEWISDFLHSGEKLVVFAEHRTVQRALVDHFGAAVHVLGDDDADARHSAVTRFQDPAGPRLCIASLKVASHGLTLTAAANVAFVELGWTPAAHDQAEDRCHRIGQNDSVTAWYLMAPDTIDDRMAALIEHKRAEVDAITDGRDADQTSAIDALLASYATSEVADAVAA